MSEGEPVNVTDNELRALVRDSIARLHGRIAPEPMASMAGSSAHASHARLLLDRGGDAPDGACLIEPSVKCTHCGYCQSYGH